jgi:hypothetical protein
MKTIKKQLVNIGIIVILVTVGLSGCNSSPEEQPIPGQLVNKEKFVGIWKNTTILMTLNLSSNGTCKLFSLYGMWDVKNETFVMEFPDGNILTYNYAFYKTYRTLYLTSLSDNLTTVFTKQ